MKLVKVGSAILNQTPLDWDGNAQRILGAIEEARRQSISILCLPELCITGYGCEDAFFAAHVQKTALDVLLNEIAPATKGLVACVGLPLAFEGGLYNCSALLCDGRVAGFAAKRYLAGDGIHYEPRWFHPWKRGRRTIIPIAGQNYPLGDFVFNIGDVKLGFEICEEAWVADRPGIELGQAGAEIILNPSASHFALGKHQVRERFVLEGSRAYGVTYLYSNLVGNEAGRAIYDGGALIASGNKLVASGPRFSYLDYVVTAAVVDLERSQLTRQRLSAHSAETKSTLEHLKIDFQIPPHALPGKIQENGRPWEYSESLKEEELARSIALGLFDYHRKSRSKGFVLSMSGGADSSATACLVSLAIHFAATELGLENAAHRFGVERGNSQTPQEYLQKVLWGVYQASENSTTTTRSAARMVATSLGAKFFELEIAPVVRGYVELVEHCLDRRLSWKKDDLALQNVQARVRSPSIWLFANVRGALLLSTSNRSEVAVGYATMDGDTSGGLAPLGGIDKASVLKWLRWLESKGPSETGPFSFLSVVTSQRPSPELRPPDAGQTAEADLMPYDVLNEIERFAIRDKRSPLECFQAIQAEFPEYRPKQLGEWVEKFFRLWTANQWKRERYAPAFHVDDASLDPRTWCRYPILSGGYERELKELRAAMEGGAK